MKNKIRIVLAALAITTSIIAFGYATGDSEPTTPPELSLELNSQVVLGITVNYVTVTSLENEVTIYDVELNRGRCTPQTPRQDKYKLPVTLHYGDDMTVVLPSGCKLHEIKIHADNWEIPFNLQ